MLNTSVGAIAFLIGFLLFPFLFYFQHKLHMPKPNLRTVRIHFHHSFYGVLLIICGVVIWTTSQLYGFIIAMFGLGIVVHHELSEPGLKGLGKIIFINKNKRRTSIDNRF